jgi:hypothetical protein
VIHFNPRDFSHDFIRGGIDDVDVISGAVGLDNPSHFIWRGP